MPSKEELSEQLALMSKLAAATERMAAAADKIDQAYSQQLTALQQVAQALGQLNVQNTVASIESLNKTLKETQNRMNDTGKTSESNFKRLGTAVEKAGKSFKDKFPKSVAIGTAALTGFYQGVENVIALTKGITGFATSFVDGLANIAASIIAIPIKIFSGLIDMAAKSAGGSNELAKALEDLRKEFGAFYGPTNKAIIDTSKSMKGFSDTGLSTWRVFGNMAERLNYMRELVTEMGAAFGKLRAEFEDNGGAILAYQKGLGLTGETLKNVTMRSASMGKTSEKTLRDMTKYSYELGDAFKLDAKLISRDMGKAMGDVAHFGGATVKQIAEASTYARKLGVELDKITGTLDAFDTYDTAAENAAKLSQAMGVQIDAFEMMQAQSPAEQLEMLRKSFSRAGVDASNFNRAQLKLVASTTGLDEATVQSALSMKNQGASLAQVQKKGAEAEKKTMTQTEAMKKLADAIERLTFSGGAMEGGFWAMFVKGIKNGLMSSKEFVTIMFEIRQALMQVYMEGVKLGKELIDLVPGFKDIGKGLVDLFNPRKITALFTGIRTAVERFFGKGNNPEHPEKGSIPALIASLKDTFTTFFDAQSPGGKRLLEGFKTFFKFMRDVAVQGIGVIAKSLAEGIKDVALMIQGKKPIPGANLAAGAAEGGFGFMKDLIMPIVEALGNAWDVIKGPLGELAKTLWEKFKDFLWEHKGVVAEVIGAVLLLSVGPAVTRSILAIGTNLLFEYLKKQFFGAAEKMAAEKVVETASKSLLEEGAKDAAKAAGPGASQGLWSSLMPFITTVPSGAAAAGAAAMGAAIGAIAIAATAAYTIWDAADMQEKAVKDYTDGMNTVTNALSKAASIEEKKRVLAMREAQIKAQEDALAEKKSGFFSGILNDFREGWELALNDTHTTTEDMIAKMKRDREDLNKQVQELNAKAAKTAENDANKKRILDAMGPITVENAVEKFNKIDALAKKVMSKDFDLGDRIKSIRDKLDNIDFTLFKDKGKEDQVNSTLHTLESIKALMGVISDIGVLSGKAKASLAGASSLKESIDGFSKVVDGIVADITNKDGLKSKLEALGGAIDPISKNAQKFEALNEAFKSLANVNTTLKSFQGMDVGSKQTTAILGLINSVNVSLGDVGTLNTVGVGQSKAIEGVKGMFSSLGETATAFKEMSETVLKATANVGKEGIAPALDAVKKMVQVANDMNDALADGRLNKIDIKSKLGQVANAVGLGGKATYTVNPSKAVQITVNMQVTMDVGEVEKVMVLRKQSIIAQRLDFATTTNPSDKIAGPGLTDLTPQNPPGPPQRAAT